jgi:hypothetical protein
MVTASRTPPARRGRRPATASSWLIFTGIVTLFLLGGAERFLSRNHLRVELQNGADAAAHAAARALVTDSVLSQKFPQDEASRDELIRTARKAGDRFGRLNRVGGQPLVLKDNPQNLTDGELYAGTLAQPLSRDFLAEPRLGFDPYHPDLNAVRVVVRRGHAAASATYCIDRDVVGFRLKPPQPPPARPADALPPLTIPLVPLAVLSQPCLPAENRPECWRKKDANTWERRIMALGGTDEWEMDPNPPKGQPSLPIRTEAGKGDGIPEIKVTLGAGTPRGDNGRLIRLDDTPLAPNGPDPFDRLLAQVYRVKGSQGVAYDDLNLKGRRGEVLLNDGTRRDPKTDPNPNHVALPRQALPSDRAKDLYQSLLNIRGQPRVWVLYSSVDQSVDSQIVDAVGFVVARVMDVRSAGASDQLTIVLQPSVLVTETAVTDGTLRDLGPRSLYNPYVARARVVE